MHEKCQTRGCFFGILELGFVMNIAAKPIALSKTFAIFNSISEAKDYIRKGAIGGTES
jgi:hypothetical protein